MKSVGARALPLSGALLALQDEAASYLLGQFRRISNGILQFRENLSLEEIAALGEGAIHHIPANQDQQIENMKDQRRRGLPVVLKNME